MDAAYLDMMATKHRWGKEHKSRVQGYHIIQSFVPGEVTPEQAHAVGVEFASRLLGSRYEVVIATHLNKAHLHCHIVFNSVSIMDGKMYRNNFRDYFGGDGVGIRGTSDAVCREYDLSVIEPSGKGKQYSEWQAEKRGKPTVRDLIRRDIDEVLEQSFTYKSFLEGLERLGYSVKSGPNVKHTSICPAWGGKNIRLDSLGDRYTTEGIKVRLSSVRSGETLPTSPKPSKQQPLSPWCIPGKRYTVRSTLPHHSQKLKGFRALYFKYLYLLGTVQRSRPHTRAAFVLRQDLLQFDRYQQQFLYLMKNHIETVGQLSTQYDALQSEIDALTDRRGDLYKQRRRNGDSDAVTAEITGITERLRVLRQELKLCVHIEGDIPKVRERVQSMRDAEEQNSTKALTKPKQHPRQI
ncbi:MAG: relaxase/mobilization nuclease domain-containing protein [Oscillospiraceae bacterium]|nr:relaxase/mobilization nuclease domain-containing protein [Oscillospiraceae bacterium]